MPSLTVTDNSGTGKCGAVISFHAKIIIMDFRTGKGHIRATNFSQMLDFKFCTRNCSCRPDFLNRLVRRRRSRASRSFGEACVALASLAHQPELAACAIIELLWRLPSPRAQPDAGAALLHPGISPVIAHRSSSPAARGAAGNRPPTSGGMGKTRCLAYPLWLLGGWFGAPARWRSCLLRPLACPVWHEGELYRWRRRVFDETSK